MALIESISLMQKLRRNAKVQKKLNAKHQITRKWIEMVWLFRQSTKTRAKLITPEATQEEQV